MLWGETLYFWKHPIRKIKKPGQGLAANVADPFILIWNSWTVGPWDALVQLLPGEIRLAGVKCLRHVVLPGTPLGPGLNCKADFDVEHKLIQYLNEPQEIETILGAGGKNDSMVQRA